MFRLKLEQASLTTDFILRARYESCYRMHVVRQVSEQRCTTESADVYFVCARRHLPRQGLAHPADPLARKESGL